MRTRLLLALFLGIVPLLLRCTESPEEIIADLEELVAEGRRKEALEEINERLTERSKELSIPLNEDSVDRILKQSPDGSRVAWVQDQELFVLKTDGQQTSIDLDENVRDFSLSNSGRFAALQLESESGCRPVVVDIDDRSVLEQSFPPSPCFQVPAVTDDGALLIQMRGGGLNLISIGAAPRLDAPRELPAALFPPRYKNVSNAFTLYQVNKRGLLIFFGAAGYYDLYFYSGTGREVKRLQQNLARPRLFIVSEGGAPDGEGAAEEAPGDETDATDGEAPAPRDAPAAPDRLRLTTADGFVYSGGAGRWMLHAVRYRESVEVGPGFGAQNFSQVAFLRARRSFLIQSRDKLYYWDPVERTRKLLPLIARKFELYSGGLAYVDLVGRLYLRKAPFSDLEIQLVQMREKLAQDIQTETTE